MPGFPDADTNLHQSVIRNWLSDEGTAALEWLLDHGKAASLSVLTRRPLREEVPEWLAGKLVSMTPAIRKEMLAAYLRESWEANYLWSDFIKPVTNMEVKEEMISHAAQDLFLGRARGTIRLLQESIEPGRRITLLEKLEPLPELDQIGIWMAPLQGEEATMLRTALIDWGADEARADAIIQHLNRKP